MLVAYGEIRQGSMHRVICLDTVAKVGKRDIKLKRSGHSRYKLNGAQATDPYARGIRPLTKALYEQAAKDKAYDLGLALGAVLPEE